MKEFERVDLKREIDNPSIGGMVFTRNCMTHEILLSFYDDDGKYAFEKWWDIEGKYMFGEFCNKSETYNWLMENEVI